MESALIVSYTDKSALGLTELLSAASITQIVATQSCAEARRLLLERDFDLVMINAPLQDESGEDFARNIAAKGMSQVILVVKSETFDAVSAICENDGVLTVAKPMNKTFFWSALTLAKSAQNRMKRVQAENERLRQKIEDIRIVDRAKWILVSCMNMNEKEAHRYIEKKAMDSRSTRRAVAEWLLKAYEN